MFLYVFFLLTISSLLIKNKKTLIFLTCTFFSFVSFFLCWTLLDMMSLKKYLKPFLFKILLLFFLIKINDHTSHSYWRTTYNNTSTTVFPVWHFFFLNRLFLFFSKSFLVVSSLFRQKRNCFVINVHKLILLLHLSNIICII